MTNVYRIQFTDGRVLRIRAASFWHTKDGVMFYKTKGTSISDYHAIYETKSIDHVVAEDMLLSSFADVTLLPDVISGESDSADFTRDTLFSDADKVSFSPDERVRVAAALDEARTRIADEFQPSTTALRDIDDKLNYLKRKVVELDKFNWKRLFITSLIGVAIDLGFGTLIPNALLRLFKEVFKHVAEHLLPGSAKVESE